MDLKDALQKAMAILVEEQVQPTIHYRHVQIVLYRGSPLSIEGFNSQGVSDQQAAQESLKIERAHRPRQVYEDPKSFVFESTNFNLLMKIFSLVAEDDRHTFIQSLLHNVRNPMPSTEYKYSAFPSFQGRSSGLALLAEFCIRTGHLDQLLSATAEAKVPTISLAIMLRELEDILALNFNLFSPSELEAMPGRLATLKDVADKQTHSALGARGGIMTPNPPYKPGRENEANEIVAAINGIAEECRKAGYFYLKGALQPGGQIPTCRESRFSKGICITTAAIVFGLTFF